MIWKKFLIRNNMWFVYILKCKDNTYYTGITTDIDRRIIEHNTSSKWAKYTRGRRPVQLMYTSDFKNKSEASKEECRIKKLNKKCKEELISNPSAFQAPYPRASLSWAKLNSPWSLRSKGRKN